ncbi:Nitrate reductase delta subunit [Anaerobranca californiensis DSM 14826]|uniref:Nitrate reductase delta subunit n=1 Tax=Anaerobranca californiensis DSM 14826 TaxID=1120989 RepID=A0A1M6LKE7_9FIRM|nr:molecular chaperone TorD family protein [Anaerobranca californiensis]SHJ71622.1 Nitrate reductase delta subunit [Anaerobranca californiensis DSM 14826]
MEKLLEIEKARSLTYYLLSKTFSYPTNSLIEEGYVEHLEKLLPLLVENTEVKLVEMNNSLNNLEVTKELQLDYSALFIGPKTLLAPPYGSVYLESKREIMGESTMDVIRLMNEAGVKKVETFKEPQDHIRIELEFIHYLIEKAIEGLEKKDWEVAEKIYKATRGVFK